ncbi:MAG: hypothetical protein M3281_06975 [Chloroflexota bacterium]|nr:hypothetical protein [Chloroflexota bacterium]
MGEAFETVARTLHLVASAAWLGGSLFYAFVVGPQLARSSEARSVVRSLGEAFGRVVSVSAWTLLATGAYLSFARLTNTHLAAPYPLILAVKIALALWMMLLAGALRRNRGKRPPPGGLYSRWRGTVPVPTLILVLGLLVFLLSSVLTTMYQAAPGSR